MATRRTFLAALATTALALATGPLAGCSSEPGAGENLPDGAALIRDAAEATAGIRSAHFSMNVTGKVPGVGVQSLDGDLTKEGGPSGAAKGRGRLELAGQFVEVEFVLVDEKIYIKGPTGRFQELPAAMAAGVYDPSAVLDPERGVGKTLTSLREPKTEAREDVDGTPAFKVTGTVPGTALRGLLPGQPPDAGVTFWLREDGKHLPVKASVSFPAAEGEPSTVDVTLSDVDKPVTVVPPA